MSRFYKKDILSQGMKTIFDYGGEFAFGFISEIEDDFITIIWEDENSDNASKYPYQLMFNSYDEIEVHSIYFNE